MINARLNWVNRESRVTGSPGQWSCLCRVGSRIRVIYLQTRYRDPVADRTTEYSMVNTWTHWTRTRPLNLKHSKLTLIASQLMAPCVAAVSVQVAASAVYDAAVFKRH